MREGTRAGAPAESAPANGTECGVESALSSALLAERERAAYLSEASRALSGSLNVSRTTTRVLHLLLPRFASWAQLSLRSGRSVRVTTVTRRVEGRGGELALHTQAVASPAGELPAAVSRVLVSGVASSAGPLAADRVERDWVVQEADPEPSGSRHALPVPSGWVTALPLSARGTTFGVLVLVDPWGPRDEAEEALLHELSTRSALAVDAAQLYGERSHVATVLQASLRPPVLPRVPGVALAARYRAAVEHSEIGGDFYDVHGEDGDWSVVMGDVCGKGVEAAVLTGKARTAARTAAFVDRAPGKVLELLNCVLLQEPGDAAFATVACGRVRPGRRGVRLDLASAGHPPVLLRRGDGAAVLPLPVAGMPAGLFPDQAYEERTTLLAPGDVVLFYTDGVLEARSDDGEYGAGRLAEVVAQCAGTDPDPLVDTVVQDVLAHLRGRPHDDIAVLALQAAP